MLDFNYIKQEFIEKHTIIDNYEYLDKYINFLLDYNQFNDKNTYYEKHHILPVCFFPEYKNESWNLIKIKYEDHKKVHLLLFKAINIRSYQRPLNWMVKDYKNSKELSLASKRGWDKLKQNKEIFDNFKLKRSKYMKTLTSDEQRRRVNIFWNNITKQKYNDLCKKIKKYWTTEKRIEKSIQMKLYYLNANNREKKSIETKKRWDLMSAEKRQEFINKMNIINNNKQKKQQAGNKIKDLWKDPIFLEKMKNRKKRNGVKHMVILENKHEYIFDTMTELQKYFHLKPRLIRKYRDTNIKISLLDLNENNEILKNALIKIIK